MELDEIIKDNTLNETIYRKKYDNGLDAYVIPKKGFNKSFASVTVKYGSNDSNFKISSKEEPIKVPDGVAHFLEHKMFEKEYGSVFDKFDKLGASANAYTTNTHTSFYFVSTENYYESLDVLLDAVQTPYFTDETVEKEKGIIIQELKMYEDDPNREIYNNLLNAMYINHPVKIDVGGSVDSVKSIDKDILYLCNDTFYRPSNMIFLSVGDVDPQAVFDYVGSRIKSKTNENIERIYPDEPDGIKKSYVDSKMDVSVPLMVLGFKDNVREKDPRSLLKRYVKMSIALEALLGRSSELYSELYDEGLIISSFGYEYEIEKSYGFVDISCATKSPQDVNSCIKNYILDKAKTGIDEKEFIKAKKVIKGSIVRSFDSIETLGYIYNLFMVKGINILEYIDTINITTISEVNDTWRGLLDFDQAVLSRVEPKERN